MGGYKQKIQATFPIKSIFTNTHISICTIAFVLFFVGELIAKLADARLLVVNFRFSALIKVMLLIYFLAYIIKSKVLNIPIILLVVSFIITQLTYKNLSIINLKDELIKGNIYFFIRYLYLPIFILYLSGLAETLQEELLKRLIFILKGVIFINIIFMMIGFLFDINLFKSYTFSERFGYCGIFIHPGDLSYLYMALIIALFYGYIKCNSKKSGVQLIVIVISSFFIGTKSILLFNFLLGCFYVCIFNKHKRIFRYIILILGGVFVLFFKRIFEFFVQLFPFWSKLKNEKGILGVLSSERNELFLQGIQHMKNEWSLINYFFGGSNLNLFNAHSELLDLYLFIGIPGLLFFFVFFVKKIYDPHDRLKIILVSMILFISMISGNLLFSILPAVFFGVSTMYLNVLKSNLTR